MTEPLRAVRIRFLPWQPRWRTKDGGWDLPGNLMDGADSLTVVGFLALLFLAPIVVLVLVGVVLLSLELLVLLALVPLLLLGQVLGLRAWQLALTPVHGEKTYVPVKGTREMLAARRHYRSLRV